jgi:hypothetical protein
MPVVMVDDAALTVRLSFLERLLAARSTDVVVPRGCVVRCFSVDEPWPLLRGLRWPGLSLPGVVALGSWRWRSAAGSGRDFVAVRGRGPGVVIDLTGHEFDRLLLSIDQPGDLTTAL